MGKLLGRNLYSTTAILSAFKVSTFRPSPLFLVTQLGQIRYSSAFQNPPFCCHELGDERLHFLLRSCKESATLDSIQSLHALTLTMGAYVRQPIYFTNNVITMYASRGWLCSARKVFDEMPHRNAVSYNALICAYSRARLADDAWKLFTELWLCGFMATHFTFAGLLSCDGLDICRGQVLHSLILRTGLFYCESYVGTALMGLLGSHGLVHEAERVFADMPVKSLVSWNSLIALLGNQGYLEDSFCMFQDLLRMELGFSHSTLVGLLSGIEGKETLGLGEQVHCLVTKSGLDYEFMVSNSLLSMYVKCSRIELAEKLLKALPRRDIVSYNTMISALAKTDRPERALELLLDLSHYELFPNKTTYVALVNCCANFHQLEFGKYIHAKFLKTEDEGDVYLGTAFVDFYGKCNKLSAAHHCFVRIHDKNVVSWNALVQSYSNQHNGSSISFLREMLVSGLLPNEFTLSAVLKASPALELPGTHCLTLKLGHHSNGHVLSSLLLAYARNGLMPESLMLAGTSQAPVSTISSNVIAALYNRTGQFDKSLETLSTVNEPDAVSWNILISACSHNGYYNEVFELFKFMQEADIYPDKYTIVSILCVCSNLCSLALGRSVHGLMVRLNLEHCDSFVRNTLLDMYGKCGGIDDSLKIFSETMEKNLITWTILISALGHHGYAHEALKRLKEIELEGFKPDSVLFISLLSACRHGGLVKEGIKLFAEMESIYGIKPEMDHYHGIVDLLSRHGHLMEAEQVISRMPFPPNALIWRSFLEGCKRQRDRQKVII